MINLPPPYYENTNCSPPLGVYGHGQLNFVDNTLKFPEKLWLILGHENGTVASWSPDGMQFYLHTSPEFINIVLPRYFKHNKLSSFDRQLNLYGFKRTKRQENDISIYCHPYFHRDRQDLLPYIVRNVKRSNLDTRSHMDDRSQFGNNTHSDTSIISTKSGTKSGHYSKSHSSNKRSIDELDESSHTINPITHNIAVSALEDVINTTTTTTTDHIICHMSTTSCISNYHEDDNSLNKSSNPSTCDSYDHYAQNNSVEITEDNECLYLLDTSSNRLNNTTKEASKSAPSHMPKKVRSRSQITSVISSSTAPSNYDVRSNFSYDLSSLAQKYNIPYHVWKKCEQDMLATSELVQATSNVTIATTTVESASYQVTHMDLNQEGMIYPESSQNNTLPSRIHLQIVNNSTYGTTPVSPHDVNFCHTESPPKQLTHTYSVLESYEQTPVAAILVPIPPINPNNKNNTETIPPMVSSPLSSIH